MSDQKIRDLLMEIIPFAIHRSGCPALGVMWDLGTCECGWEKLEKRLEREGILPPTRKCEHCGCKVLRESFSTMGVCTSCSRLLCHDCLEGGHNEPGTCERSHNGYHTKSLPIPVMKLQTS